MRGPLARLVPHLPRSALERVDRWMVRPVLDAPVPVARRLAALLRHLNPTPRGVSITPAVFGGVPGEIVAPDGVGEPPRILYAHGGAYVIFYLVLIHTAYFLFIHFTLSFHKEPPPVDWFRIPFVVLGATVIALQTAAFVKTVAADRRTMNGGPGNRRTKRHASARA